MATGVSSQHPPTTVPYPAASSGPSRGRSHHKPRKFSSFMKKLANLKSSTGPSAQRSSSSGTQQRSASFSHGTSGYPSRPSHLPPLSRSSSNGHLSFAVSDSHEYPSASSDTFTSPSDVSGNDVDHKECAASSKSRPPRSATTATTSSYSSRTPSVRSLTTTLTTIQSTAPGSVLNSTYNPHASHHHNPNGPPQMYSAPFPPPHSPAPSSSLLHPATYNAATANGVWTDNASIITLASSSKRRRRRHSADTDASVRAMAPSSVFGGSRESLPLSVLSSNFDSGIGGPRSAAGERASLYGRTGVAAETASLSNGNIGGTGSIMGEIAQSPATPVAAGSPLVKHSRRGSAWDDDVERRSLSARSASLVDNSDDKTESHSVRDGSSNIAVWNGVAGKHEKDIDADCAVCTKRGDTDAI